MWSHLDHINNFNALDSTYYLLPHKITFQFHRPPSLYRTGGCWKHVGFLPVKEVNSDGIIVLYVLGVGVDLGVVSTSDGASVIETFMCFQYSTWLCVRWNLVIDKHLVLTIIAGITFWCRICTYLVQNYIILYQNILVDEKEDFIWLILLAVV